MQKDITIDNTTNISVHLIKENDGFFYVHSTQTITQELPQRNSSMTTTKDSIKGFDSKETAKIYFNELVRKYGGEISSHDCKCDNSQCAKCLLVNCSDDNCPTHPLSKKLEFRGGYNK